MSASPSARRLRIGQLAARTGVTPALLRAWERRYGVLDPGRSAGGYRLYDDADAARVLAMKQLVAGGVSPAQAAPLALAETGPAAVEGEADAALAAALERFDNAAAQTAFDVLLARYAVATLVADIVLPYLAELGERWARGEATVGQEHFATALLRARLLGLGQGWDRGNGPYAVLACPGGERHDIGLVGFGLLLRSLGWRIAFLGADTPAPSVADAAARLDAAAVVLGLTLRGRRPSVRAYAPPGVPIAVGGRGATAGTARAAGALLLPTDLGAACAALDATAGRRAA